MTLNLGRRMVPLQGGTPIRLDPRGGVPRTTRLTIPLRRQKPIAITAASVVSTIPIRTGYPGRIPIASAITRGRGTIAASLPAARGAVVPTLQNTATGGVFGGVNGGVGSSTTPPIAAPLSIGGISASVGSAGSGIMNTIGSVIPLAIKIIIAVIVIKIVWWLIKGRRR